ncbi:MAG TPA: hypothetical protein VM659_20965 [Dongiaceae bacterium]|nr:hypothetical protein [Dongiaceae bacterium]
MMAADWGAIAVIDRNRFLSPEWAGFFHSFLVELWNDSGLGIPSVVETP